MKALILVGGFGTRLRPLTLTCPKPLVEFANKPMVIHQITALKEVGCNEIILAVNYQPQVMEAFVQEWSQKLGIKITISQEHTPMGTAGPLAIARKVLDDGTGEPFFVLNSDVICYYPLKDMLAFHKNHGKEGTILVTKVQDPSAFGVVVADEQGLIDRFVEKPKEFVGDQINAGIYLMNPTSLRRIQEKPTSIERETFPAMAADKQLCSFLLQGFWMDVGKPKDFLQGQGLYLGSLKNTSGSGIATGSQYEGLNIVDESAKVGANCKIGPNVSIGAGCVIEDGVCLRNSVIMKGCTIKEHAYVKDSIVGWKSRIGVWARLEDSVIGEDVAIKDEIIARQVTVLPNKEIKESVYEPKIIL